MAVRFTFTAQFWGDSAAVVCRAVEERPGPLVEQQFGEFSTWTQAHGFATKLNEGLDLDPLDVRQIVTSSLLATACVVQQPVNSELLLAGGRVQAAARAVQLRFILEQLSLALTFCRSAASYSSEDAVRRIAWNVGRVLRQSARFLNSFDGDHDELKAVSTSSQQVNSAFQYKVSCPPALSGASGVRIMPRALFAQCPAWPVTRPARFALCPASKSLGRSTALPYRS